ncbi:hypothetical protein [Desulfosporosinus nitroreducens]|uniref:hypothetical protein n=1 Tax=Desulfosporosinus nitroreducens TaxID=2018668 RepID=UPI00207C4D11|nr:hypothetical protein [Desulfosporosinus nitroreducens]MCO1599865.1 hypothetical protein [Desulfosporosinus nitroreducens]
MQANEKLRPAVQCQTEQGKIQSRVIIPRDNDFRPVYLWGFIGSVKEFRQLLKAQLILLNAEW